MRVMTMLQLKIRKCFITAKLNTNNYVAEIGAANGAKLFYMSFPNLLFCSLFLSRHVFVLILFLCYLFDFYLNIKISIISNKLLTNKNIYKKLHYNNK